MKRLGIIVAVFAGLAGTLFAQAVPSVDLGSLVTPENFSYSINLLLMVSSVGFIPFLLMATTSFLRIVIVLSMIRMALGTQQAPPNMAIVALAMFLTIFVMTPVFHEIYEDVVVPYREGRITQFEAIEMGSKPMKKFMLKHVNEKDLTLFLEFSQVQNPEDFENVPIFVVIPSFLISEMKAAFQIGFLLFIPFVVIDLIVSNILLTLGMFMLSPAMISLPFKILLFVLTDGWHLIVEGLITSYQ